MDKASGGVLLKGLPFGTTKNDIKQFFRSFSLQDDSITFIVFRDTKQTGVAFVKLSKIEVQRALLMDRNHIGNRYIEVIASDEIEMYDLILKAREGSIDAREINKLAGKGSRKTAVRDRSPIRKQLSTKCAYINGIPTGFTYKQVREFFRGCLIARNCIHLLRCDNSNVFRGDGYIEFGDKNECLKGLKMSGEVMGGAIIKVSPCSIEEMSGALDWTEREVTDMNDLRTTIRRNQAAQMSCNSYKGRRTPSPVRKRMKAYAATYGRQEEEEQEPLPSFQDVPRQGDNHRVNIPFEDDPPHVHRRSPHSDMKRNHYYPPDVFEPEQQRHHWPPPDRSLDAFPPDNDDLLEMESFLEHELEMSRARLPPEAIRSQKGHHGGSPHPPRKTSSHDVPPREHPPIHNLSPYSSPPQAVEHRVTEHRVVRLEGLPYEVNVRDVIEFFHGYHIEYEHVRIQCREDGSPSGVAFVSFQSEKHARSAVHSHNRQYILGRFVELFLV